VGAVLLGLLQTGNFATSEPNLAWYVIVPVLLALYYAWAIYHVRQIAPHSALVPQYSPPQDMSPGEMRYLLKGEFDERIVVADIVHLAARGLVRFEGLDEYYAVCKTATPVPPDLPGDELAVYRKMFNLENGGTAPFPGRLRTYQELPHDAFLLPPPEEANFILLAEAAKKALRDDTQQKYFTNSIQFVAPAAILSLFLSFLRAQHPVVALFAAAAITLGVLSVKVPEELLGLRAKQNAGNLAAIRILFLLVCLGILTPLGEGSVAFVISLALVIALNLFLAPLLRTRTPPGVERVQQIEGYREFLKQVELDRMARMKSPEWVPNASTEYLAYALALDLGDAWDEYLAHSGCEVLVVQKGKSGVFPQRVRLHEPDTAVDAFLGFALAMVVVSGATLAMGSIMGKFDFSSSAISAGSLAFIYVVVLLALVVAMVARSK